MRTHSLYFQSTRALLRSVLEQPYDRAWSTQGLGMLRTYLDKGKVWRVNLWHSSCVKPGVSTIHDHPWDFQSLVVCGTFKNRRYREMNALTLEMFKPTHCRVRIRCGDGGGPVSDTDRVFLQEQRLEVMLPGDIYSQAAEEIHESKFVDGTVTINERKRRADGDHANIYWPVGQTWVDAEPHMASREEIKLCTEAALRGFDAWQ